MLKVPVVSTTDDARYIYCWVVTIILKVPSNTGHVDFERSGTKTISGVFPSGRSHRSDGAALKIYYDALKNSEPLTQAFKDRGTIVFTTAFCPYLPSMAVAQLLIIEI